MPNELKPGVNPEALKRYVTAAASGRTVFMTREILADCFVDDDAAQRWFGEHGCTLRFDLAADGAIPVQPKEGA